ncbi:MAG: hypothetical protein J6T54_12350 [Fibrobacter sp.]|nr:hypothetical protein [Fibrobacter sp.]
MINVNELINKMEADVADHKNAIANAVTTDKCIVVCVHLDFGSGIGDECENTIGLEADGVTTKYVPLTYGKDVVAFTIKDAMKACKTKLSHEKGIPFTYKYELVDVTEWHKRRISALEDTIAMFKKTA